MKLPVIRKLQPWQINMAILPSGAHVKAFDLIACENLMKIAALFNYESNEDDNLIILSYAYGMATIEADFAILKMMSGVHP